MNNQFIKTRLQLTAWYLVILMIVSFVFSVVVYTSLNAELLRNARREQQKVVAEQLQIILPKPLPDPNQLRPELVDPPLNTEIQKNYDDSRNNLILMLVLANVLVLGLSAIASYTLAGKTLKPIEQMLEDQKKFVANASHDLRTPLTMLKTAIEVTLKMGPIPYKRMKGVLESNLDDVNALEKLTNNLLIIEKFSDGFDKSEFSVVEMDKLVKECVNRMTPKSKVSNVKIVVKTSPIIITGIRQALCEMVNNILDNAIKYNKPSGSVDIRLYPQANNMILQIKDTGIGIESMEIPHIFDRFYRADKARNHNSGGYGLGLAIAYQVIKQHKGKVHVDSIIGKGSTFIIQLPMK